MANIKLGTVEMPINAATKSFAVLAKRGAGKTYLGGVMAEEFYKARVPFVVFDPIDVWWGLRLNKDGKSAGLPVVVFGIEHADILLDRDMGPAIARAIVRDNVSCVISTFGMPKVAARHLITEFSEELLRINDVPRHVFIEEAHEFVPQRISPGAGKTFAAVEALVTMGRNRGIGVTMLNQRAATINKDVLTQIDTLLALRSVGPQDRKAIADWVEHHEASGDFNKFIESLPSLPTGQAWIWSPEFMGVFEKFTVRKRETFHPDREKIGSKFVMPELGSQDIESFIKGFKTIPNGKQPVASTSKKRTQNTTVSVPAPVSPVVDRQADIALRNSYESQLVAKDGEIAARDAEIRRLTGILAAVKQAVGAGADGAIASAMVMSGSPKIEMWRARLGRGAATKILDFLTANPGERFTKQQIGLATGLSMGASTIRVAIGKLIRTGLVRREDGKLFISPDL